ncbi:alpha-galactosidase [Niabella pedocola]|uniref:Alpha-galactosidase n=1 Tax=Niabella pedocola TaxID=1752077 RepID=A0ABS8PNA2_9BACT|nr:alpha-galactosidase [Niabella pedocola]MCD2422589.1 alpha-galactosidase [Niabella pedocola]
MRSFFPVLFFLLTAQLGNAQADKIFIETNNTAIVYKIGKDKKVSQVYIGNKLGRADYAMMNSGREMYLTAGMENQFEPAIRAVHNDGNPSLDLQFEDYKQENEGGVIHSRIVLKDPVYPFYVTIHFKAYMEEDVIKTWTEIRHAEKKPVMLTQYASSLLHFDARAYWLTQFHGDWAREVQLKEEKLNNGIKSIESKLGTRTNFYQTQTFFVSLDQPSTENEGRLIAGTLGWTGNFKYSFEVDQKNGLRVISGINPFASEYYLRPNEIFETPEFIFTFSGKGKGLASRNLHKWVRNHALLDGNAPRMTLLNNWEATHTSFNETRLVELFDEARNLGVDLFLLDDGWFGNKYPRNDDKAGLGDWQPDKSKLPNGIAKLVKEAGERNIKFGIWLEPEMVNPKSELYEKHPDWILKLPNRAESYGRNQLVLDLTNPAVQDFVFGIVDQLMTQNPGVAFIKWDCNRSMTNAYSAYLKDRQSHLYINYTKGFYEVMKRIRKKYPHLPIMLCAGGGGRTDYKALEYFTEFWPSDNTDALERIFIQWGYSYFFPSNTISAHVTSMGKQSLKFRTDVAMMGKMGYDIRINNFTAPELEFSKNAVKTYKDISEVIWKGDLYRLVSPYDESRAVIMYVNTTQNRGILFNYFTNLRKKDSFSKVRLQGLDPAKRYRIREINLFPGVKSVLPENEHIFSGAYLMEVGLNLAAGKLQSLTSNIVEIAEAGINEQE